jgi:cation:H+ antiporter
VTIIAVGISLPELVSSVVAVVKDSSEIVVGNVVGSNVTNICLIIGVVAVVGKELDVTYDLMSVDLPLLVSSAFFLAVTLWDGSFTVLEAFLCIAGFALYLLYAINVKRKHEDSETEEGNAAGAEKRRLSHKI